MKHVFSRPRRDAQPRFIHFETFRSPETASDATPEQVQARGQILETMLREFALARSNYDNKDAFVETDDPDTQGIYVQWETSGPNDEMAIDPSQPSERPWVKLPGEIIVDQHDGLGFADDVKVLSGLDMSLLSTAGFADKSEMVSWLRRELAYATEVANMRLEVSQERRNATPDVNKWNLANLVYSPRAMNFAEQQTAVLQAQANLMTLPGDLDRLEQMEEKNPGELTGAIEAKIEQVGEAGFDVSAFRKRLSTSRN